MSDLATILEVRGRYGDALEYYRKAGRLGFNGARVKEAFMLPAIMGTKQEVLESRMHFEQKLADLMNDNVTIDDPMKCISSTNFYLAYQGLNDRNLQIAIAKYYENACPSLLFTAPHCKLSSANKRNKIRLGIFSEFMYSHSISNCYSQILENLSLRDEFEVLLISNSKIDEGIYKKFNGEKIFLPNDLATARKKVANMELDLIIYLDIGMSPFGYFLAFSRLAPVQCVLGGHPVTTGIPNMDYFISNALMEPEDAVLHYSEKLVNLPRPLFIFERPAIPPRLKTRQELGLPIDRHIYLCPMKLQKIHPDFDDAISRILQIDSEGVIIFFEDDKRPSWAIDIKNRFERTIPDDVRQRILFRPWIKYQDELICTIAAADVVLDPFHFGIGSTAAYTFAVGTPLVTKEGEFLRGRVGSGFCRMLGVAECSVETTESYCQMAADIVINKSLREGISSRILKNNSILYENTAPIDDFIDFICSSYADAKIV